VDIFFLGRLGKIKVKVDADTYTATLWENFVPKCSGSYELSSATRGKTEHVWRDLKITVQ